MQLPANLTTILLLILWFLFSIQNLVLLSLFRELYPRKATLPLFFHQTWPCAANKYYFQHQSLHLIFASHDPLSSKSGSTTIHLLFKIFPFLCLQSKELIIILSDPFINNMHSKMMISKPITNLIEKLSKSVCTFAVSTMFYSPPSHLGYYTYNM